MVKGNHTDHGCQTYTYVDKVDWERIQHGALQYCVSLAAEYSSPFRVRWQERTISGQQ